MSHDSKMPTTSAAMEPFRFKRASFIPEVVPWTTDRGFQTMVNVAFNIFHHAYNSLVQSATRSRTEQCPTNVIPLNAPHWFPETKLYIEAAREEFERQLSTPTGPRPMWRSRKKDMPALGHLQALILERLPEQIFPDRPEGVRRKEVEHVMLRRRRAGWVPEIHIKIPFGLAPITTALRGRNRYCDIGLAVTPHVIALSIRSPHDAYEVVDGRVLHSSDFSCGLPPAFIHLTPSKIDLVSPEVIALRLWNTLQRQRLHIRTFVIEESMRPRLRGEDRREWKLFVGTLRRKCQEAGVAFSVAPPVQERHRNMVNFWTPAAPCGLSPFSNAVWSTEPMECPKCGGLVLIQKSPRSGIPFPQTAVPCEYCRASWDVGDLMADRARSYGARSFSPRGPYDLS